MDALMILIPCAMALGGLALAGFFWALGTRQYEDMEGAAARILLEEEPRPQSRTIER
jgi:cbb3-type cytochrome oxidase maturation protein